MLARNFRPKLEEMDARSVPSVVTIIDPPIITPPALIAPMNSHPLYGSGSGSYTQPLVVDAGISRQLNGRVSLQGFGTFNMSGWVQGTGMIQSGRATGHLVLSNPYGTLTLELHGPIQNGFSPVPSELVYSISGGTGSFSGVKGYGVVQTSFTLAPVAVGMQMIGHFRIAFN